AVFHPFSMKVPTTDAPCTLSLHDALPILSAARSSTGIGGTIREACPRSGPSQAVSLSRSALSSGTEYRNRNEATFSPVLRFCIQDRNSTRLNSSHVKISYAVFCLTKKNEE